ncbi:hypothetical protein HUJ04_010043 [Dendroctonus ponderosae]|nr:hypothetical protein HUJ04_010043 [Dendroctonus ponderosae]KAH1027496.1 hypothetical protein HUJ05_000991 [Dendroctonus ponderosae]
MITLKRAESQFHVVFPKEILYSRSLMSMSPYPKGNEEEEENYRRNVQTLQQCFNLGFILQEMSQNENLENHIN